MERAYKFRIYPNQQQRLLLAKHLDVLDLCIIIILISKLNCTKNLAHQ